jgi:hypothetical protein
VQPLPGGPVDQRFATIQNIMKALASMMSVGEPSFYQFSVQIFGGLALLFFIVKVWHGVWHDRPLGQIAWDVIVPIVIVGTMLRVYAQLVGVVSAQFWQFALVLDARQFETMLTHTDALAKRVSMASIWDAGPFMMWILFQLAAWILKGVAIYAVAGPLVKQAVYKMLGILTLPWLLFDKGEFLFWGFAKGFLVACLSPVVAFAQILIFSEFSYMLLTWLPPEIAVSDYGLYFGSGIALMFFMAISLWQSESMAAAFVSGHTHGSHSGSFGAIYKAFRK